MAPRIQVVEVENCNGLSVEAENCNALAVAGENCNALAVVAENCNGLTVVVESCNVEEVVSTLCKEEVVVVRYKEVEGEGNDVEAAVGNVVAAVGNVVAVGMSMDTLVAEAASGVVVVMAISVDMSVAFDLCGMTDTELNECKPAVTKESPTSPSQLCCNALQHADFSCLCGYKHSPWLGSLGIDPELAIGLPTKCGLPDAPTC